MTREVRVARTIMALAALAFILAVAIALIVNGGGKEAGVVTQPTAEELQNSYLRAVDDARVAEPGEIYRDLTALVAWEEGLEWEGEPGNSRVLVVVWTGKDYYDSSIGQDYLLPDDANVWVTAVPDLQDCFLGQGADLKPGELRLKQLLGLPPDGSYTKFVELWVSPSDLFRPSPDPEINDCEAELSFPTATSRLLSFNDDCTITQWDNELNRDISYTYEEWFTDRKNTIYYGDHPYPWTGLGYTYDWGDPGCEVGLSEFVILGGSTVGVQDVVPTADYLGI